MNTQAMHNTAFTPKAELSAMQHSDCIVEAQNSMFPDTLTQLHHGRHKTSCDMQRSWDNTTWQRADCAGIYTTNHNGIAPSVCRHGVDIHPIHIVILMGM